MKTSKRIVSTNEIKSLTRKQREALRKLAGKPDSQINFSDIPEVKTIRVMGRGPLTPDDRKRLLALSKMPDSELKNLPPGYVVSKYYRRAKQI